MLRKKIHKFHKEIQFQALSGVCGLLKSRLGNFEHPGALNFLPLIEILICRSLQTLKKLFLIYQIKFQKKIRVKNKVWKLPIFTTVCTLKTVVVSWP